MNRKHLLSGFWFLCALVSILLILKPLHSETKINSLSELQRNFSKPPMEYGTVPFSVWNDDMTESEIEKQLIELKEQGAGSIFIHPRPGLITPYLSDTWLSLCKFTVDKGKQLGMNVWLYDENSYPSGFAGGHVPAQMPESIGKGLLFHRYDILPNDMSKNVSLVLKAEGSGFADVTNTVASEKSKQGKYYVFEIVQNQPSGWYGGFAYVDLMLPGVTEKFLDVTLENGYKKSIGDEFGKAVPGIFTDEPQIAPPQRRNCMKWTPALFSEFEKKWGYDLKINLPSLFEEVGDWQKIRHNYYALLLDLFIERWAKVYYRYCEQNNLQFTGHYWEHGWPLASEGPDNMAMYAWFHMPGIDILMNEYQENTHAQFGNVRAVKELRSAANQMGRSRTMSETYGAAGWDLRFEDMKRIGDWEYALGVNFMNQHLSYITIKGARKRDHPQSFTYHEPWWKFYHIMGNYFARLSMVLSSGEQINKILVIEPTSSAWMYNSNGIQNKKLEDLGNTFYEFEQKLEKLQVEYDLGSENIIKDNGKIEDGKFVVGKRSYDIVVLPPGLENLEKSTVTLIEKYLQGKGKIISFVDAPKYIDGSVTNIVTALASQYSAQWMRLNNLSGQAAVDQLASEDFKIINPETITGVLFHHRRLYEDGELLFLINTSLDQYSKGTVKMKGRSVTEMNLMNGAIVPYPLAIEGNSMNVTFDLPPAGSLVLITNPAASSVPVPARIVSAQERVLLPKGSEQIKRITPNTLTLDYCDIKVGINEEKDLYFYEAQNKIYKYHGLEGNPWSRAVQYKTNILDKNNFGPNSGFEATYSFLIEGNVDKASLQAVVERPNLWTISINGHPVQPRPGEWWLDRAFGIYDIGSNVVSGTNQIKVTASPFTINSELESIYILGNFGLIPKAKGFKMIPSSELSIGAWDKQNMPFYSDGVSYINTFTVSSKEKSYCVKLSKWNGTIVEVKVNNKPAGVIAWQPYQLDISDKIQMGDNEITVTVYGSLKNLLGPHHNKPEHNRAWPAGFEAAPKYQPEGQEYDFIGYGLFEDFVVTEK